MPAKKVPVSDHVEVASKYREETEKTRQQGNKSALVDMPVVTTERSGNKSMFRAEEVQGSKFSFHPLAGLNSSSIAIRIKELDQCCCADVPCVSIVKEYCESSSLHGLRYITEDGRHWTERVLWVLLCLCGFILTIYFITPIWAKWNEKPTITTLDSTDHPVWAIDFPAVTVCPSAKISQPKFVSLVKQQPWRNLGEDKVRRIIEFLVQFRGMSVMNEDFTAEFNDIKSEVESIGLTNLTSMMASVSPDCRDFILQCWWQGHKENCSAIFSLRKTNDGFCCSFNAVDLSDNIDSSLLHQMLDDDLGQHPLDGDLIDFWVKTDDSVRDGRRERDVADANKIRKLNSASHLRGLTFIVDSMPQDTDEDFIITSDIFQGFKVLIHSTSSYPEAQENVIVSSPNKELFVAITAAHTEGSKAILDFPFEGRSCLFKDERDFPQSEVTVFKEYTQENCLLECRAKILLHKCGCLPYFYPRLDVFLVSILPEFEHLKNVTICSDWQNWTCLADSNEILDAIFPENEDSHASTLIMGGAACHCPPTCARTSYAASATSAAIGRSGQHVVSKLMSASGDRSDDQVSLVHVFYRDLKVFKYHTDELFSWENILASFGGLIGLCTGFSFLSAAELVYFFTLRCTLPLCRKKRNREKVAMLNESELVVVKVDDK